MPKYKYDYDYDEYTDTEDDYIDDTLVKRRIITIIVLFTISIVGFTIYGIVFYDFTPFVVMGFFLSPVIIGGAKLIWEKIKEDIFEDEE